MVLPDPTQEGVSLQHLSGREDLELDLDLVLTSLSYSPLPPIKFEYSIRKKEI